MALEDEDEGDMKRICDIKDKGGILIWTALRKKLLSLMLF